MGALYGYGLYFVSLLTMGAIYAVVTLGLNVQWGFTGLFNAGTAGFFAVGAYTVALLTTTPSAQHIGGLSMPFAPAILLAMALSAAIAWAVGKVCLRLRSDYLAIATVGIAEIIRLVLKTEGWATNGPRGIAGVPAPFEGLPQPWNQLAFLVLVTAILAATYAALEVMRRAPWGRLMMAVRDNEAAARAAGKDVERLRIHGFVIGCAIMALGGGLMVSYLRFVDPSLASPLMTTFLVWVMLIVGGSANNRGAILGAYLMWFLWSCTELVTSHLPPQIAERAPYIRIFLIGLALQFFLQRYPTGLLPEIRAPRSRSVR